MDSEEAHMLRRGVMATHASDYARTLGVTAAHAYWAGDVIVLFMVIDRARASAGAVIQKINILSSAFGVKIETLVEQIGQVPFCPSER